MEGSFLDTRIRNASCVKHAGGQRDGELMFTTVQACDEAAEDQLGPTRKKNGRSTLVPQMIALRDSDQLRT